MKKFTYSVAALVAMSTISNAGGDIVAVEPVAEIIAPVVDSGFYVGIAYSAVNFSSDYDGENINDSWTGEYTEDYDSIMLQVGYKINKYFAVEGRYWDSYGDAEWVNEGNGANHSGEGSFTWKESGTYSDAEFTAWGLYVKPMYPVTEAFDVYALLGYGNNTLSYDGVDELDENGFQWGIGASYDLTDNFALFADYVRMHADETSSTDSTGGRNGSAWTGDIINDDTIYTLNFGVTYKF
ncbi:MAG: porin family protein [Bacteroidota bacterium]